MRYLILVLLVLQTPAATTIQSVEISGIAESSISQALRDDMQKLVGQKFDQTAADNLSDRVQDELPGYIAASRLIPGSEPDRMKLVFVVVKREEQLARLEPPADPEHESNINSRYTVESAEIQGLTDVNVSDALLADLHRLVGRKLDQEAVRALHRRLSAELKSRYDVSRRVARGEMRDHVKVIFDVKKVPLIIFERNSPEFIYHSKQALTAAVDVGIEFEPDSELVLGWTIRDQNSLIERFDGLRVGFENTSFFTDRLGIQARFSTYRQKWNGATLAALPAFPGYLGTYRRRDSFEARISFAFDPRLSVEVGAGLTQLDMDPPGIESLSSNAGVAAVNYKRYWETTGGTRHAFEGNYSVRAATHNLDSDLVYTRHFWRGDFGVNTRGRKSTTVSVQGGRISGEAPLFERFSLGNAETLRGWNKFDVAPIGGDRFAHGSLEFGFHEFLIFYDAGSVWDSGQAAKVRHAVGLGFGSRSFSRNRSDDQWFVLLGFPIESARIRRPLLTMGFRF